LFFYCRTEGSGESGRKMSMSKVAMKIMLEKGAGGECKQYETIAILSHPIGDSSFQKEPCGAGMSGGMKALFIKRVARR